MYDSQLRDIITTAVSRIDAEMAQEAPFMAQHASDWMRALSGSLQPAGYFLHPLAFPMLLLPWWAEKTCHPTPDLAFQSDLAYSTVNGYYYIRLIDNVMDGDVAVDLTLLPALNFFHTQFQAPYQRYFSAAHPFWNDFRRIWFRSGEAAMQDASLTEVDETLFVQIAAQKVCAARIPVAAVCYHHQRLDLIEPWFHVVDLLGCWHQMMNDVFDWHKDMEHQSQTYFLSEAGRRKASGEAVTAWVVKEGFAWGSQTLHTWMAELKEMAQHLQSPDLSAYLEERDRLFSEREAQGRAGLQNLTQFLTVLS